MSGIKRVVSPTQKYIVVGNNQQGVAAVPSRHHKPLTQIAIAHTDANHAPACRSAAVISCGDKQAVVLATTGRPGPTGEHGRVGYMHRCASRDRRL